MQKLKKFFKKNKQNASQITEAKIVREATQEEIKKESKDAQTLIVFELIENDIVLFHSADGLVKSFPKTTLGMKFSVHKHSQDFDGIRYHYYVKTPITHIYFFTKENAEQYLRTLIHFVTKTN